MNWNISAAFPRLCLISPSLNHALLPAQLCHRRHHCYYPLMSPTVLARYLVEGSRSNPSLIPLIRFEIQGVALSS